MIVTDINGKALPEPRQQDWQIAKELGLHPSPIRFMNGEPLAVYDQGGIYGPLPRLSEMNPEDYPTG